MVGWEHWHMTDWLLFFHGCRARKQQQITGAVVIICPALVRLRKRDICVWMFLCVHVFVQVYMCVRVIWRSQVNTVSPFPYHPPTYFVREGPSLNLEIKNWLGLLARVCLALCTQLSFSGCARNLNSGPLASVAGTLLTKLSLHSPVGPGSKPFPWLDSWSLHGNPARKGY